MEKGFLFTSFQMIIRPGISIRNYIEGKRKPYQPPVSYFLIWITIFILALLAIEKLFGENTVIDYQEYFGPGGTTRFAISHLSMVLMVVMPFQALYLYLFVTRIKYNYFESLVAIIYALGTVILFQFVFSILALILYAITSEPVALRTSDVFKVIYMSWFVFNFTNMFRIRYKWLRAVIVLVLSFGTFTLWRMVGFPALFD